MGTVFRALLPAQVQQGSRVAFFVRHADTADLSYFGAADVEMHRVTGIVSLVRQLRQYDVVHLHSADLDLLLAGWLSRRVTVFTLHGLRAQTRGLGAIKVGQLPTLRGVRRRLKRLGFSLLLRHAIVRVTTVSEFLVEETAALYRVDRAKVTVVHNGIALGNFTAGLSNEKDPGRVVGWVGRLVPVKRVDMLLRAVASIASQDACEGLRVLVVGDGPLRRNLTETAATLGIAEIVHFVGHTNSPEKYFAQMDIFAFPSQREGAPMAVNEAMASALPVIVLEDGGGAAELVRRSGGGVVAADEAAFAAAIISLLSDPERRQELAERGRAHASRELDPLKWAERFDRVYRDALASR